MELELSRAHAIRRRLVFERASGAYAYLQRLDERMQRRGFSKRLA